jgi:hypothetical protein
MSRFDEVSGWSLDVPIADPVDVYRMPLLHWAFYLGKLAIIRYILSQAVLSHSAPKLSDRLWSTMKSLHSSLMRGDTVGGNTPLHLCCEMLASNDSGIRVDHPHLLCIIALLDFISDRNRLPDDDNLPWNEVLNIQNHSGDTPLHIVCRNDTLHALVGQMIDASADRTVCNAEGCTPLDVARNCKNVHILNQLTSHSQTPLSSQPSHGPGQVSSSRITFANDHPRSSQSGGQPTMAVSAMVIGRPQFVEHLLSKCGLSTVMSSDPTQLRDGLLQCDASVLNALRTVAIAELQQLELQLHEVKKQLAANDDDQRCLGISQRTDRHKIDVLLNNLHQLDNKQQKVDQHIKTIKIKMSQLASPKLPPGTVAEQSLL